MPSLEHLPTATLTLALGFYAARPIRAGESGRLTALADELSSRAEYEPLLASLSPQMAASIRMVVLADRGQCWARRGTVLDNPSP